MERKVPFEVGEYYHVYTRGVEKRTVFTDVADSERFLSLLLTGNDEKGIKLSNVSASQRGFPSLVQRVRKPIVDVCAYALMPNHMHLILRESTPGGISRFMLKVMTGYSMYFNTRFERSGPLFTRPFRSKHIDSDEYLRWVFAYTVLNPLSLHDRTWTSNGLLDKKVAGEFIRKYKYGSFCDYFDTQRPESAILQMDSLPFVSDIHSIDDLLESLSTYAPDQSETQPFSVNALV